MALTINNTNYIVAIRVNHDTKEFSVTRRIPELAGCKVIDNSGSKLLNWDWLRLNHPDKPEINNWLITDFNVTREEGTFSKAELIAKYLNMGYTKKNVKNFA
jgi:hypothetical protein